MNTRAKVLLTSFTASLLFVSCSNRATLLEDYGPVPDFSMTDAAGHPFNSRSLSGKAWVADFIYTNCPAACPMMTAKMHGVEKKIHGNRDIRLVSISVDPERDTPAVLDAFAERYGGPTRQWLFLTGTPATIHQVAFNTFHVGDIIGKINHSTKFVLVDKHQHIRGYYSSVDAAGSELPKMLKDLVALSRQSD